MDEKPKSIWKKSWTGWGWLWAWLILAAAIYFTIFIIGLLIPGGTRDLGATMGSSVAISAVALVFVGLLVFIHWVCSWKNFRRFLFACACLATLIALFYAEEDWRGRHDWEMFKQKWEAKGEKFDFASVVPPPVPDDQNFALTPIVASCYETYFDKNGHEVIPRNTNVVDRLSMVSWRDNQWTNSPSAAPRWPESKFLDLKPWQDFFRSEPPPNSTWAHSTNLFPVTPEPQSPAEDVLLALSKYDSVIQELRQASQLPYSRFPLTYDKADPAEILLPHLAALKSCAQTLTLRAIAELRSGQGDKALTDVKLALYLANSIRTEPFMISHLVRIAIFQITLQPVYEGLAEHKWSDAELAELDSELAKLDFLADYKLCIRGEMGLEGGIIEYLRSHPEQFDNITGNNFGDQMASFPARIVGKLIPNSLFYQNRLNCARMMVEFYIPLADVNQQTVSPAAVRRADEALQAETKRTTPFNFLEGLLLPSFYNAVEKFAYAQSSLDLARVAVALERYRLAHGEFPESLDTLAPQFMEKIPHDVIGGGPLHYRRTSDGQFVLYFVGWNERDDGGVVVLGTGKSPNADINQGDWVWRYPQK